MPRPPKGRVGRSAGAAEHRVAKHRFVIRLSPTTALTRVSAIFCVVALAITGAPTVASAQTSAEALARTRAEIDATANQWFAAQREAADLDVKIESLTKTLEQTEHQVAALRDVANARAVELYETGTQALEGVMGGDPLEVGRRAELIGQANANGQVAIDEFEAAIGDLKARRDEIRSARADQTKTLHALAGERNVLDAELDSLELRSAHAAQRAELAATIRHRHETATTAAPTRPAVIELATPPVAETTVPSTSTVATTPDANGPVAPSDAGRTYPNHDEPFLVCTRARESDGNYSVISPDGYYGAYQFARTTWNVTAAHAGRLDLVGVLPSSASPYDQDEMAWTLYQWQGNSPWGGRC
jgi:peptidoglycan hydrolase CwlO-like protein